MLVFIEEYNLILHFLKIANVGCSLAESKPKIEYFIFTLIYYIINGQWLAFSLLY